MAHLPIHRDGHNQKRENKWYEGKVTSQGGKDHRKAVARLIQVFEDNGLVCETGRKFLAPSPRGDLPYEPDVWVDGVVVEVDGKNHGNKIQMAKDAHRDAWFEEPGDKITWFEGLKPVVIHLENGAKTVRYWTWDIVGRKKLSNREIMEHFWYEVDN